MPHRFRDDDDEVAPRGARYDTLDRLDEPALLHAEASLDPVGDGDALELGELA